MPSDSAAPQIDVAGNRAATKFSAREQVGRILWWLVWPLFRFSPRPVFWPWRVFLLRLFGAQVGKGVRINPSAEVFLPWTLTLGDDVAVGSGAKLYSVGPILVGDRATISQYAHICAGNHDFKSPTFDLIRPTIEIGAEAWVAADAFVAPGVRVGRGAIVSARAAVFTDVADFAIVQGNPAQPKGTRTIRAE